MIHDFRLGRICYRIATLGPIGFLPGAGTIATLLTACVLFVGDYVGLSASWVKQTIIPLTFISTLITHYAVIFIQRHDPPDRKSVV